MPVFLIGRDLKTSYYAIDFNRDETILKTEKSFMQCNAIQWWDDEIYLKLQVSFQRSVKPGEWNIYFLIYPLSP